MKSLLLLLIFISISSFAICQNCFSKIFFSVEEPRYFVENYDSLNYYIIFEDQFFKDSISVYCDTLRIFEGEIKSSALYAKKIKLGSVSEINNVSFKFKNYSIIELQMIENKNYIRIKFGYTSKTLSITFSEKMPLYNM
jgi:hypothetical protein